MLKVKICGLTRTDDINIVNELLPDYVGFVLAKSKREISVEQARLFRRMLDPNIKSVGVFVNAPVEQVLKLAHSVVDIVQLHGDEDLDYVKALRSKLDLPIIKAVRLKNESSLENLQEYACDYFLFDTYDEGSYGGCGKVGRVELLRGKSFSKPYFIAGGLASGNVAEITKGLEAFGVDVSGGVETSGIKDMKKIAAFIRAVRQLG